MKRGFTLIEMLVVITIIGILLGIAVPNFMKAKNIALEGEVRTNVLSIHHSLERYAGDHYGYFPGYIWGGNDVSWCVEPGTARTPNFSIRTDCRISGRIVSDSRPEYGIKSTSWMILDPLIRYGYLSSYPRNPFLPSTDTYCETLRNDPRFGCSDFGQPSTMGNVLPDPNFPSSPIGAIGVNPSQRMGMIYFTGDGNPQTLDWIPGMFIYRSWNSRQQTVNCPGNPPYQNPDDPDCESIAYGEYFILAAYGSFYSSGKDILCDQRDTEGLNCFDVPYGTPGREWALPSKVMRDAWDPDMDGNINSDDCNGNGITGELEDCDMNTFGSRGLSFGELSKRSRAVFGRPDGKPDGIIVVVSSQTEQ
ncbi:MAG: type II secretion system protein [bacterium JZ-2024 1]